jgi:hypothetical protein
MDAKGLAVTGIVTAIVLVVEWFTGATLRDDILGRLFRAWLGAGVSVQLVATHDAVQGVVAAVGVVLVLATILVRRRDAEEVSERLPKTELRALLELAERETRARLHRDVRVTPEPAERVYRGG